MRSLRFLLTVVGLVWLTPPVRTAEPPREREFLFTYEATITGLESGRSARVWLPVPPTNEDQTVAVVGRALSAAAAIDKEPKYGNQVLYAEARADERGQIPLALTYRVKRREAKSYRPEIENRDDLGLYLRPDAMVPVGGKPVTLLEGRRLPDNQLQLGRLLYDVVNGHMRYNKEGSGWGRGDAAWACDSKRGNCTDFHSLFIALARSQQLPARFEIGFALPSKRGRGDIAGYHCWAKFYARDKGWVPVDIAEASQRPERAEYCFGNLSEDRVTFSIGRDLVLVPKQDGPPLNFFIYPYVEVAGEPYPAGKVKQRFSFEDVAERGR